MFSSEYELEKVIVRDIDKFMKECADSFGFGGERIFIGNQVRTSDGIADIVFAIKQREYIDGEFAEDILKFIVVELKNQTGTCNHIGQLCRYMNFFDNASYELMHDDNFTDNNNILDIEVYGVLMCTEVDSELKNMQIHHEWENIKIATFNTSIDTRFVEYVKTDSYLEKAIFSDEIKNKMR